jgi:DNA recombination protein RmuC
MIAILVFAAGLAAGGLGVWLALRGRVSALELDLAEGRAALAEARATLELEQRTSAEKLALLDQAKLELSDAFKALSADALRTNQTSFLELARTTLERYQVEARDDLAQRQKAVETLVEPLRESLVKVDGQIQHLERARSQAYGALTEQLRSLTETQERLRSETGNLVNALRTPAARGRWGEIQLRKVVEMAGMLAHCDFVEQVTATADERRLRPDLIVKLPGGKNVVVDAKAPLQAYLEALEAPDEETKALKLADHARQIRDHVSKLSMKGYWEQFRPTPEFVVLFIPGEAFYSAALQQDPGLIELGVGQRVLIATPTTLIGVLKAVSYGWHQETVAESARAVSELGRELHGRIATLGDHVLQLGRKLDGAVQSYNQTVGSLERRVLPAARRFADLGAGSARDIPVLEPVDKASQVPQAPELSGGPSGLQELTGPDGATAGSVRDAA